jgi:hypothetical protein
MYSFEKLCDSGRLTQEIEDSAIITALDYIVTATGTDVYFKATLSGGDETILNALVAAHVNTPLPDSEVKSVSVVQADAETGGLRLTPKFAPDGWHQQYFETEFETSNSASDSIHEKNWENEDLGYSSLKFYKVVNGAEVECTDQTDIDSNCIRTDLLWMPPFDYSIKSGWVAQKSVPANNMYVWALGADLDAAYGGPQAIFAEGGINLTYVDARTRAGLDGVSGTILHYNHPQLGDGAGTNRIRFVVRHSAGVKHRIQAVMELFLE